MIANPTHTADGTGSWGSNGNFDTAATLTTGNNDYLEFAINTTNLSKINLSFFLYRLQNGPKNWAIYYGPSGSMQSSSSGSLASATTWYAGGPLSFTWNLNPTGLTYFRIYGYNAQNSSPGGDMYVDDVTFSGCGSIKTDHIKIIHPFRYSGQCIIHAEFLTLKPQSRSINRCCFHRYTAIRFGDFRDTVIPAMRRDSEFYCIFDIIIRWNNSRKKHLYSECKCHRNNRWDL